MLRIVLVSALSALWIGALYIYAPVLFSYPETHEGHRIERIVLSAVFAVAVAGVFVARWLRSR